MSLIDEIIEVTIKSTSNPITKQGLNTLLIIGDSKKVHRSKAYSSLAEVKSDYDSNTVEYKAANLAFSQDARPAKILIGQCLNSEKFEEAYPLIAGVNNDFYGVMITSRKIEDQLAMSELIEADEKILGLASNDKNILETNEEENVLFKLKALNRKRTFVIYNSGADTSYIEAAWFGLMFSMEPGSATWNYKSLNGCIADNLSSNDRAIISSKSGNYFVSLGGRDVMFDGRTTKGEWIDTIWGLDWLNNTLKYSIAGAFIEAKKIPYTNQGLTIIENMVRSSLGQAGERGIIDKESIAVFVPDVRDIALEQRQGRVLPDVRFEARLVGAIHKIKISGTVTV